MALCTAGLQPATGLRRGTVKTLHLTTLCFPGNVKFIMSDSLPKVKFLVKVINSCLRKLSVCSFLQTCVYDLKGFDSRNTHRLLAKSRALGWGPGHRGSPASVPWLRLRQFCTHPAHGKAGSTSWINAPGWGNGGRLEMFVHRKTRPATEVRVPPVPQLESVGSPCYCRGARNLCSSAAYANDTALPWGFITFLEERKDYVRRRSQLP